MGPMEKGSVIVFGMIVAAFFVGWQIGKPL